MKVLESIENSHNIHIDIITEQQYIEERGKRRMLWESVLAPLKDSPDKIIKLELGSHQTAKYKQASLGGSLRKGRNKWYTGKITTKVEDNILYIRIKKNNNG